MTVEGLPWSTVTLGDLLTRITYGFTNPMPTTAEGPWMVTAKDVNLGVIDYASARHTSDAAYRQLLTDKSRPRIGDILLTKDGSIGRVAVCDRESVCINQSVALLQLKARVDSRFLAYLLQAPTYQDKMASDADGSTIKHIYITRVDKMQVCVPEPAEQRAIAEVLGALDDKIAANAKLAGMAFDLATALYGQSIADTEPQRVRLESIATHLPGRYLPKEQYSSGGRFPVYGSNSLMGFHSEFLRAGPFAVLARIGSNCGSLQWSERPAWVNNNASIICASGSTDPWILRYALNTVDMMPHRAGSGQPFIRIESLLQTDVLLPDTRVLSSIAAKLQALSRLESATEPESRTLAALRDTLLPQLMSGKLRVKDIEKQVEEAV